MIRIVWISMLLSSSLTINAQRDTTSFSLGYFAPYGTHIGSKAGLSFNLKNWEPQKAGKKDRIHKLNLSPQIGYFFFSKVQHNYLINFEASYQSTSPGKRFSPLASVALGYLMARQKQGGAVSLATGDITYDVKTIHYFTPTVNLGFTISTKRNIGYYLKGFCGRKITTQQANSALFGLELGISAKIKRKNT